MDHPAALHRLKVGVPATVEHASESGDAQQTSKWVAETTQVRSITISHSHYPFRGYSHWCSVVIHQLHGCNQTQDACKGPAIPDASGAGHKLLEV
jgi:hypothetical protein